MQGNHMHRAPAVAPDCCKSPAVPLSNTEHTIHFESQHVRCHVREECMCE